MAPDSVPTQPEPVIEPQTGDDFIRRGWIYHVKGEHALADADFREALNKDPQSAEASYGMGMSLKIQKRGAEARSFFEQTIQLLQSGALHEDPSRATMLRHLSRWHISTIDSGQFTGEPEP